MSKLSLSYRGLSALSESDPTRTATLRQRFSNEMTRRFKRVRRAIIEAMLADRFHLLVPVPTVHVDLIPPSPIEGGRYTYRWSSEKADEFMKWLEALSEREILELIPMNDYLTGRTDVPWTNTFIDTAYQQGIRRGRSELRAAGEDIPDFGDLGLGRPDPVMTAFNQPFHADRVGLIYSRVWTDLKGVTAAMDTQISRVLALGMAEGRNPREIAREMAGRVDAIGITRARLIARTEVIRTHNEAKLNEFERVEGMTGSEIKVKWVTALDERVRDTHRVRHGKIYTRAQARGLIGEPNCRCTLIPVIPKLKEVKDAPTKPKFTRQLLPVERIGNVSNDFINEIREVLNKIPGSVNKKVFDNGWVVKLGEKMTEIDPGLKDFTPRGWPSGSTWDSAAGAADWDKKRILGAETYLPLGGDKFAPTKNAWSPKALFSHEYGHAVDDSIGASQKSGFKKAWRSDVDEMELNWKKRFSYFTENVSTRAARQESFAELFAMLIGHSNKSETLLQLKFSRTVAWIKGELQL